MSRVRTFVLAAVVAVLALPSLAGASAPGLPDIPGPRVPVATPDEPEQPALYRFVVPHRETIDELNDRGFDLAERVAPVEGGFEVDIIATPEELTRLAFMGLRPVRVLETVETWRRRVAEREAQIAAEERVVQELDDVKILRADYFVARNGTKYLSVEAKHAAGIIATDQLVLLYDRGPGTPVGSGGAPVAMSRFVDSGVYLYHRTQVAVSERPSEVMVVSALGGQATRQVRDWLNAPPPDPKGDYLWDFISRAMDPTEVYQRIETLAAEYPGIAEIVELPYKTHGYRRPARATLGTTDASRVVVASKAYGHEGGNDIRVSFVNPGAPNHPLTVKTLGSEVTVELGTNAAGTASSTAAQVAAALNEQAAALVSAHTYRGNAGGGVVAPASAQLSDNLKAPARISREPVTVKVLRIRGDRENVKTGVFLYAQEHAREWVTPLVAVETAERLVRNYDTDPATKRLVDDLDIFILPSVNPDGGHYSFYDFNMQRRNMSNHCGPENSDPGRQNAWGVDLNRNFTVGSRFDGYSGASSSCTSDTYSGPAELSEAEAKNEVWLTERFPNIRFAMNTHSYGDYFMWAPGAYVASGRIELPRPQLGHDHFFWESAEHILNGVKAHRGTVVTPARTGPVSEVLYSAAGNSADEHYYNKGIFGWSFEAGNLGFQPAFADLHEEAMEYANGWISILEVARKFELDRQAPTSELVTSVDVATGDRYVRFRTNEPADVYYTTDGSRPTFASTRYKAAGLREGPEVLTFSGPVTIKWFAADVKGQVEGGYDPSGDGAGYRQQTVE
ncbi:MAG TPA: M14 family metallopeptidase [Actinomycetota bacterium]|nr:M14 family metallopeptidase [Actinomycetota bacterium]